VAEYTLPRSFESEISGCCGRSLHARRSKGSDGYSNLTSGDVVIACDGCDAAHCILDVDNPLHVEEISEAKGVK
jgi:hypothetical protein